MISNRSLILLSLLLLNISIEVQSIPVKGKNFHVTTSSDSINAEKNKRDAPGTSAGVSDHSAHSDLNMNSNQIINLLRKRRNTHEQLNKRHKRASHDIDSLYAALLIQPKSSVRPTRPFTPIYWSPESLERNVRFALETQFSKPLEWNSNTIETYNMDVDRNPFYTNDYEDESDYEYNRYPIALDIPYDNLQLQQEYNTDDVPIDDDETFISARYNPFDDYFK